MEGIEDIGARGGSGAAAAELAEVPPSPPAVYFDIVMLNICVAGMSSRDGEEADDHHHDIGRTRAQI